RLASEWPARTRILLRLSSKAERSSRKAPRMLVPQVIRRQHHRGSGNRTLFASTIAICGLIVAVEKVHDMFLLERVEYLPSDGNGITRRPGSDRGDDRRLPAACSYRGPQSEFIFAQFRQCGDGRMTIPVQKSHQLTLRGDAHFGG